MNLFGLPMIHEPLALKFMSTQSSVSEIAPLTDRYRSPEGGGSTYYICSTGICRFQGYRFLPIFARTGYQKKAIFLESVVKTCQSGIFLLDRAIV